MTQVQPIPAHFNSISAHLVVYDAKAAIEFYQRAFGATLLGSLSSPDGKQIVHASLKFGNSTLMLGDECREYGHLAPTSLGGTPVTIHLYVEDADAAFEKAVLAGATIMMPVSEMFWGDRYGKVSDPFGHQWSLATHVRDVSYDDMTKGMAESCAAAGAKA